MGLAEGSIIMITLRCGCSERRVTVIQGHQQIVCPECNRQTDIFFEKDRDGRYEMTVN